LGQLWHGEMKKLIPPCPSRVVKLVLMATTNLPGATKKTKT